MKTDNKKSRIKNFLRSLGVAGFLFFLLKGLVWLGIALFAGKAIFD